jgi:hypothetical protein
VFNRRRITTKTTKNGNIDKKLWRISGISWLVGHYSMFIRARAKPLLDKIPKPNKNGKKHTNPGERNSKQNYKNVKNFENHSLGVRGVGIHMSEWRGHERVVVVGLVRSSCSMFVPSTCSNERIQLVSHPSWNPT